MEHMGYGNWLVLNPLLIFSSFSTENRHPLLICSSPSTARLSYIHWCPSWHADQAFQTKTKVNSETHQDGMKPCPAGPFAPSSQIPVSWKNTSMMQFWVFASRRYDRIGQDSYNALDAGLRRRYPDLMMEHFGLMFVHASYWLHEPVLVRYRQTYVLHGLFKWRVPWCSGPFEALLASLWRWRCCLCAEKTQQSDAGGADWNGYGPARPFAPFSQIPVSWKNTSMMQFCVFAHDTRPRCKITKIATMISQKLQPMWDCVREEHSKSYEKLLRFLLHGKLSSDLPSTRSRRTSKRYHLCPSIPPHPEINS